MQVLNQQPQDTSIALITSFMHQRNGDLVASISFMKSFLKQYPYVKFEWIIKRDISGHKRNIQEFMTKELKELSNTVTLTVIDSIDYAFTKIVDGQVYKDDKILDHKALTTMSNNNWGVQPTWHGWKDVHQKINLLMSEKLKNVTAFVFVANPHRLVKEDHEFFHGFGKPIFTVPEYSLKHVNNIVYYENSGDTCFKTGFFANEGGVYVDEIVKFKKGFESFDPSDEIFLKHLIGNYDLAQEYRKKSYLFYGYFFDNDELSPKSYTVKTVSYIKNTIMLSIDKNDKLYIDIVIPGFADSNVLFALYMQALTELPTQYKIKIKTANYNVKNTNSVFDINTLLNNNNDSGKFRIRLINPVRLQRINIQILINEAEPFIGLTGDASWLEGLMKGKITCYQIVNWKINLFHGFLDFISKKLPQDSFLRTFYELQSINKDLAIDERWQKMRSLYLEHKEDMLKEANQLATFIESDKNINKLIIPAIGQRIVKLTKVHQKKDKLALQNTSNEPCHRLTDHELLLKIRNNIDAVEEWKFGGLIGYSSHEYEFDTGQTKKVPKGIREILDILDPINKNFNRLNDIDKLNKIKYIVETRQGYRGASIFPGFGLFTRHDDTKKFYKSLYELIVNNSPPSSASKLIMRDILHNKLNY